MYRGGKEENADSVTLSFVVKFWAKEQVSIVLFVRVENIASYLKLVFKCSSHVNWDKLRNVASKLRNFAN